MTYKRYFYPHVKRMETLVKEAYTLTKYSQGEKIPEEEKKRLRAETDWSAIWREYMMLKGKLERAGLNYRIQGPAATQTKLAAILFYKNRTHTSQEIMNLIHDEMLAKSDSALIEETGVLLSNMMQKAGEKVTPGIPMPAQAVLKNYWDH